MSTTTSIQSYTYCLLLLSATSTLQVSIVSWNIASVINYNRQEIYNVVIVVSKGIQTLILISCFCPYPSLRRCLLRSV